MPNVVFAQASDNCSAGQPDLGSSLQIQESIGDKWKFCCMERTVYYDHKFECTFAKANVEYGSKCRYDL